MHKILQKSAETPNPNPRIVFWLCPVRTDNIAVQQNIKELSDHKRCPGN